MCSVPPPGPLSLRERLVSSSRLVLALGVLVLVTLVTGVGLAVVSFGGMPAPDPSTPGGGAMGAVPNADERDGSPAGEEDRVPAVAGGGLSNTGSRDPTIADASIVELYPNPVADGDVGEYIVLELPVAGNWTLSDGYHEAAVPDIAHVHPGRVAVSMHPSAASEHTDVPIHGLEDHFPLADDGDIVELRYDGMVVDVVAYDRATRAHVWRRDPGTGGSPDSPAPGSWSPYGLHERTPVDTGPAPVEGFVLPDAPDAPVDPLSSASDRLYIAAYTLESWRLANLLIDAETRGVDVRVLVDGGPVGGMSRTSESILADLADAGVRVRVLDGPKTRFSFHHAKYAVADDSAVVLTENWKPAGTGGAASRGWGVTVDSAGTADELARLFANDAGWRDARRWPEFRAEQDFYERAPADEEFPTRFDPVQVDADRVRILTAPDNAGTEIIATIDEAEEDVLVVVPRAGGTGQDMVRALERAGDRGVSTRLLLSGMWYDVEDNRELAAELNDRAAETGGALDVRVADPRGRFAKIHAKGIVVDDTVIVGSLNWNDHAMTKNREVLLAIESERLATFFRTVFVADWRGGSVLLPLGFAGFAVLVGVCGVFVARREISFTGRR